MRTSEIRDLLHLANRPEVISLAGGLPDPAGFPIAELAAACAATFADDPHRSLQYGPTEGDAELRQLVAARHRAATGRTTTPDQVLVTSGSQQALDLLARVLADPGDPVGVEDPCYLGALGAFAAAGLTVEPVPTGAEGLDLDELGDLVGARRAPIRFLYTTPTFHNPTGSTLPEPARRRLAALADRHDLLVVEDDPYGALHFDAPPPASLAAHSERVVTLGTVSKILAPGLRVGWMVGPEWLVRAAARAKQAVDLHTSSLGQALALRLLGDGERLAAHLDTVRRSYAERAATLVGALRDTFGDHVEVEMPRGGMFVWARLPGVDTRSLLPYAIEEGTAFVPGDAFAVHAPATDRLRLSFATTDLAGLVEATTRLARAVARRRAATP